MAVAVAVEILADEEFGRLLVDFRRTDFTIEEQGLLDILVDPNFTTNRFYYVYYTAGNPNRDRICVTKMALWPK